MLDECAPGWWHEEKTHFIWVFFNGLTYRTLPKHQQIKGGHIKNMIRFFKIDMKCARKHLEFLQG